MQAINATAEVREMLQDDESVTVRCARCNKPIPFGKSYATVGFVPYDLPCVPFAVEASTRVSIEELEETVRKECRALMSANTRRGLEQRKARIAAEQHAALQAMQIDTQQLLAMGM